MSLPTHFRPERTLVPGRAASSCRAIVTLPVRNEEATLGQTLDALAAQVDLAGRPLAPETFEVILLLNNCTDASAAVARRWAAAHQTITMHLAERRLPKPVAHIGMARRLLMDTAWHRLREDQSTRGILTTDADTLVAPDWIARTLCALERGADAVGGTIRLKAGELDSLPAGARQAYLADRCYQALVALLEDRLDPQAGDPAPRHLEHFGSSLACTRQIYARAGGMPPVSLLEDVAFVDRLRRADARLRHDPEVVVYTSLRLDGRTEAGLSGQLRLWQRMQEQGLPHMVFSAAWLCHRFRTLCRLRAFHQQRTPDSLRDLPSAWRQRTFAARGCTSSPAHFLATIDCDRLVGETFTGEREGEIRAVIDALEQIVDELSGVAEPASAIALQQIPISRKAHAGTFRPGVEARRADTPLREEIGSRAIPGAPATLHEPDLR